MKTLPLFEAVVEATALMLLLLLALVTISIIAYLAYNVVRLVCWYRGTKLPYFSEAVDDLLSFKWPFKPGDSK